MRIRGSISRALLACAALAALLAAPRAGAQADLRTQAEESGFTEYTTYENQMTYLKAVQAASTEMKLGTYGETFEGRELPYAVFSRPTITHPAEAMALGRPIILFQANVHGIERTLRESLLILIRELATSGSEVNGFLDHMVIIVAPQVNPDGFEAQPRSTRGNSWGVDMNRDYIKLEQAAIQSLVQNLYLEWWPHLIIDGHNGGARPYNINYITTGNASPDQRLVDLCNDEIFPLVHQRIEESGMKAFYYPGGNAEYWRGAPHYPRICMTYASFMGSLGITFESPGQPMETGVGAGVVSFKAVWEYVRDNSQKVLDTVATARRETIELGMNPGGDIMVQMEAVDQDYTVSYEIRDPDNPEGWITIENGKLRTKPNVLTTRPRPYAYILPRQAVEAVALLRRHDITVEKLTEAVELEVQGYTVASYTRRSEYDHAAIVQVVVDEVLTFTRTFPAGSYVVHTAQMQGRVVTHMLEPETDDNVIHWNTMDALLPRATSEQPTVAAGRGGRGGGGRGGQGRAGRGARRGGQRGERGQRAGGGGRGGRGAGAQAQQRGGRGAGRGGRGGFGGRGGRGGRGGPPVIPIYKLMTVRPLPTMMIK